MKLSPTTVVLGIVVVVVVILIAISATRRPATQPTQTPRAIGTPQIVNTVTVSNQIATSSATIDITTLAEGGYVVIHEATPEGTPGGVIGYSNYLQPGGYSNVLINLTKTVKTGSTLFAMLHSDDGDRTYGFPDEDLPLKDAAGKVILQKFTLE